MALNFPSSPTVGDVYTDTTSGFSYEWDGTVWKSYTPSSASNIKVLDDISGSFNGSQQTFALTSSSITITPISPQQLRIVLGGVVQSPGVDYNVSGSNIVFTTAPSSALSFSGILLGPAVPVTDIVASVYVKQTYSATAGQTNFTFTSGYTVGYLDVYRNGVRLSSGTDFTATDGNTFILTNPANLNDEIESIGYQVSELVSNIGILSNLSVSGISTLNNLIVTGISTLGIVTGATYYGDGSNLTGIGTIQTLDVNGAANLTHLNVTGISTLGIVTGATYYGDGSNLTGVISGVEIKEEGSSVGTAITSINFVGSDLTATATGAAATITVSVAIPAGFNELDAALFN